MPVTGNSTEMKDKILSIRLSADGLSFWINAVSKDAGNASPWGYAPDYASQSPEKYMAFSRELGHAESIRRAIQRAVAAAGTQVGPVCVMPDTCKTVLVPEELFDRGQVADYLLINNIAAGAAETAEVAQVAVGAACAAAVIVYDREALNVAREVFGDRLHITSPLEAAAAYSCRKFKRKYTGKDFAALYLTGANVYITVCTAGSGVLKYCEVLPYSSAADILYYMQEVGARFDLCKNPVYIKGIDGEKVAKLLKKTYKKCKCE